MTDTAPNPNTPRNAPFILLGSALAIGYWVVEAYVDTLLLGNVSLATRLFTSDPHELWMRSLTAAFFIAFGLYSHKVQARIRTAGMMQAVTDRRLQDALAKILSGYLPICAWCKKIRNQAGEWDAPETFITARTGALFSHGICSECLIRNFPDEATGANSIAGPM